MRNYCIALPGMAILFCFFSCKKENQVTSSTPLLKKVVYNSFDTIYGPEFFYDSASGYRLAAIKYGDNNGLTGLISLAPPDENGLAVVTQTSTRNDISSTGTFLLQYENGYVIKKYSDAGRYIKFGYDALHRLVYDSLISENSSSESKLLDYFTYDGNDDIVQTISGRNNPILKDTTAFTYSDSLDPYHNYGQLIFVLLENDMYLHKHNLLTRKEFRRGDTYEWHYSHTYNNNQLLHTDIGETRQGVTAYSTVDYYYY